MKSFIILDSRVFESSAPAIPASNHSYRYGDGLFETMKMSNGRIPLGDYHFSRLLAGMKALDYKLPVFFTPDNLKKQIKQLAEKNNCLRLARIRLAVSRGNGGLYDCDNNVTCTIECLPADESINRLNETGILADLFPDGIKTCDKFSNLKTASCLLYVMAAQFAKNNGLNDAFVLNNYGRLCETTIANIFLVKDERIYTPPLSEGCVKGVMRSYLLEKLPESGFTVQEKDLSVDELIAADEVILTNAVFGMRWIRQFRHRQYKNDFAKEIYRLLVTPLCL
jgi:branched-chain amino acid aminotransferase